MENILSRTKFYEETTPLLNISIRIVKLYLLGPSFKRVLLYESLRPYTLDAKRVKPMDM